MKTSINIQYIKQAMSIIALLLVGYVAGFAKLATTPIISSDMVLQREKPVHIWGTADAGERVTVSFGKQKVKTKADAMGKWFITLQPMKADAHPQNLVIKGKKESLIYNNVVVGEVWIAAGQSNMQYSMKRHKSFVAPAKGKDLSIEEMKKPQNPMIRVYTSLRTHQKTWAEASGESLPDVSTVGYYFIRNIQDSLKIPVGIITVALGGTRIEAWTPKEAYEQSPVFSKELKETGKISGWGVGAWYKSLMLPVIPYTIRGFLWYQGENNCGIEDGRYAQKFKVMTDWWKLQFKDKSLPFYYVLLAPHIYSDRLHKGGRPLTAEALPQFREQQKLARNLVENSEYITIFDLVDNLRDIHPSYKWFVGQRLARIALHRNYGYDQILYQGPELERVTRSADGKKLELKFAHAGEGLRTCDGHRRLEWFEVAGKDGIFHPALADIHDKNQVSVFCREVKEPEFVRLGWHEVAEPNLVNSEGLTVIPFGSTKAE